MAPPSRMELEAIERTQLEWAQIMGADTIDLPELGLVLVRHALPGLGFNMAARVRWSTEHFDTYLAALQDRMRADGRWPSLVMADGLSEPADMDDRLRAAGWSRLGGERIMFTRHAPVVPHLDPALRVEAVLPQTAIDAVRIEAEAFGHPEEILAERAQLIAGAIESGAIRVFLLRLGRTPVASTRLALGDRVASLHGVAVSAGHRRKGYGRMITAVATRAGLVTGHGLVWLSVDEANTGAVELYRSLGYEMTFAWSRWAAADTAVGT